MTDFYKVLPKTYIKFTENDEKGIPIKTILLLFVIHIEKKRNNISIRY
jgi:hypothetical protein